MSVVVTVNVKVASTPPRLVTASIQALFLAVIFLCAVRLLHDPDTWWHLRTGELIVEGGDIPRTDPFSFSEPERSWVNIPWAFQVTTYGVARTLGLTGLTLFRAALATLTLALLVTAWRRPRTISDQLLALVAGAWAFVCMTQRLATRPEMWTELLIVVFLTVLAHSDGNRLRYLLVPLQVMWANLHGLFIFGPMLVLAWLVGEALARRPWKHLVPILPLLCLACVANPLGLRGAIFPFQLFAIFRGSPGRSDAATITELLSPLEGSHWPIAVWGLLGLLGAAMTALALQWRKKPIAEALLFCAAAYLGLTAWRNLGISALIAGWLLARRGESLLALVPSHFSMHSDLALAAAGLGGLVAGIDLHRAGIGLSPEGHPVAAVEFLDRENIPDPLFCDQVTGDYLIWRAGPRRKVFIDGRTGEMYSPEHYSGYLEILGVEEAFARAERRFGFRGAILQHRHPLSRDLAARLSRRTDWALVYYDAVAAIFLARTQANEPWVARFSRSPRNQVSPFDEARWPRYLGRRLAFFTDPSPNWLLERARFLGEGGRISEAEQDFRSLLRKDPDHLEGLVGLGTALLARGRIEEAAEPFEGAIRQNPHHFGALTNLGIIRLRQGRVDAAEPLLRTATELEPRAPQPWVALAGVLEQRGDLAGAAEIYRQALSANPYFFDAHFGRARVLATLGDRRQAAQHLQTALRADPNHPQAEEARRGLSQLGASP